MSPVPEWLLKAWIPAALLVLSGCAADDRPRGGPVTGPLARYGLPTPEGFRVIASEVPDVPWQQTFFRIARDIRLLPALHPEIERADLTLLANAPRDRLLFCAAVRFHQLDRAARRDFLRRQVYALFDNNPKADFQRIQRHQQWDLIHSEGVRRDADAVAQVVIYAVNRQSSTVYLLGGVWPSTGIDPFAMDRTLRELATRLTIR